VVVCFSSEAEEFNAVEAASVQALALCYIAAEAKTLSVQYGVSEAAAFEFIHTDPSMQSATKMLVTMAATSAVGFYKSGFTVDFINASIRKNVATSGIPPSLAEGMFFCNSNTLK
jgi:hypothetical protein